jgi:hypothetical protein
VGQATTKGNLRTEVIYMLATGFSLFAYVAFFSIMKYKRVKNE